MYESTRSRSWTTSRIAVAAAVVALGIGTAATASAGRNGNPKPPGNPDPKGQLVELQLLAFNDYHGHLDADPFNAIGGKVAGGAEYLSAKLAELRAGEKHSLTVAAGDMIGGSPFMSGLFHDEPSVETLNVMGLDVSSVGNHEFDEGVTELLRMQYGGCHPIDGCYFPDEPYAGADFPWLAANVKNGAGETPLPPYWITRVESIRVAFIGMTLEDTPSLVAQAGIVGWNFLDEAATANALVPELQAQGVEAIVVLLHEGGNPNPVEVNGCTGLSGPIVDINALLDPAIDVLITGHTHQPYNCVLPDKAGQPRIVTSAYSFGRVVSEVDLVLDKRTRDVRRDLSSAMNHGVYHADLDPDPAVTKVLDKWRPLADVLGNEPVGEITGSIVRATNPNPTGNNRGVESSAGNLVADAQLWATVPNGAQIAFMNPGGLRSDLSYPSSPAGEGDGVLTYGEAFTFQPFGNLLSTIPMSGAQIQKALEQQCQPGQSRTVLHLGVSDGFTYDATFDITTQIVRTANTDGSITETERRNCTGVTVSNMQLHGMSIDPTGTYLVTVNNFLVDGGDRFGAFAETDRSLRIGGGDDLTALIDYMGVWSPVDPPSTDRVNATYNVIALAPTGP